MILFILILILNLSYVLIPADVSAVSILPALDSDVSGRPALRFDVIQEGLISNQITSIKQDSYGFLWIGTNSGLTRYDGINFKHYISTTDSSSLADNSIGAMYEDRYGNFWIGSRSKLSRYRWETDDFVRYVLPEVSYGSPTQTTIVSTIQEDKEGTIWVSGGRNGLYYYDKQVDRFYPYKSLITSNINNLLIGEEQTIWLTTGGYGLQKLDVPTGEITAFRHDPENPETLSSDLTNSIKRDSTGGIWVGSRNGGINRMIKSDKGISFRRYWNTPENPDVLYNNAVYTISVDRKGRIWTGNDNGGLHLYDRTTDSFHLYISDPQDPTSLSHKSVSHIYQDRNYRLWVGTALSGLNYVDPYRSKFAHFSKGPVADRNLNNNIIRFFSEDEDGNFWIATDGGGINHFNRKNNTFSRLLHDPDNPYSLQSDAVMTLNRDPEGQLWAGSYDGGLDVLVDPDEGRFVPFQEWYDVPDFTPENVFDICFDSQYDYLWISEYRRGLFRYNLTTGEVRQFQPNLEDNTGISSSFILRILEDSRNNLWFATLHGLSKITAGQKEAGQFIRFDPDVNDPESIAGTSIRHMVEGPDGSIWFTTTSGLSNYDHDSGKFTNYYVEDGLPTNDLQSIVKDENGYLWIGSIKGLTHFNPESGVFTNYDPTDGLQGNEFSRYAAYRLTSGELLFGGTNGYNLFHPDSINTNPFVPPVYITDFKLFHETVHVGAPDSPLQRQVMVTDTIILSHDQNTISFDFIAVGFTNAEQNEYAYKMEGFDSDWFYAGSQRNATYTNLDPGNYLFRVNASNNDGLWNEEGASIAVIIVQPFWQKTWFYLLLFLLAIGLVATGLRFKTHQIARRNRQLETMVERRTAELLQTNIQLNSHIEEKNKMYSVLAHDLRNPFVAIIGFAELLNEKLSEDDNSENREIAEMILSSAQNTHHLLENLLHWSGAQNKTLEINNRVIDLTGLVGKAIDSTSLQANLKNITVEQDFRNGINVWADETVILTVLRNLLTNAIKFSNRDSRIVIGMLDKEDEIIVSVVDEGVGMDAAEVSRVFTTGSGLQKRGTRGEKGSGFGLMLCKEFITRCGGSLWVESAPGKGSTFYFSLKKAEQDSPGS